MGKYVDLYLVDSTLNIHGGTQWTTTQ